MAAHIDDLGHVLDGDGTNLHAGAAGGAGPQSFGRDNASNHRFVVLFFLFYRPVRFDLDNAHFGPQTIFAENFIAARKKRFFDTQDNFFGVERLAGIGRGTYGVAATAFCASVAIEQLLPGKLFGL